MPYIGHFFGGTKQQEYKRTIELFKQIYETKGLYYALALLYDSQYDRKDLKAMMDMLETDIRSKVNAIKKEVDKKNNAN